MGSIPGSSERYSPSEVRAILKDLLEDLSPSEIEDALTIVTASAIAQLPITITTGDFDGSGRANWSVPNLLDSLFGPTAGAIEDIVKDDAEAAAFWRDAMNQAFGLIPIPGNAVAKWAIKRGVRELIDGFPMERDSPDAAVQAAQQALVENTVLALYADEDINAQIVDAALDDWPATRTLLVGDEPHIRPGGQELTVAEANEVHRALIEARRTGEPLDPEVFVQLPDVVNLIEELEDELTLSPERAKGNG